MESPPSSEFSVVNGSPEIPDLDRTGTHAEDLSLNPHNPTENATPNSDTGSTIPEYDGKPMFEHGDGDIKIEVGGASFEAHKYLLKRFNRLKDMLNQNQSGTPLRIHGTDSVEDFQNTLKVLYATVLEGPFEFESSTLVSALRIATRYQYHALRAYAISHLELAQLTAIERIKIAREFGLASWEEPAYVELCERDEPITRQEASILGMDMFVRVAEIREQEQRRRGKEVDSRRNKQGADEDRPIAAGPSDDGPQPSVGQGTVSRSSGAESSSGNRPDSPRDEQEGKEGMTNPEPRLARSFVGMQTGVYESNQLETNPRQMLIRVSGCECRYREPNWGEGYTSRISSKGCSVSPCAAAALKNIQLQQAVHSRSIVGLQSSMSKLIAPPKLLPEVPPASIHPEHSESFVYEAVRTMLATL